MRVKVKVKFADKDNFAKKYEVGSIVTFDNERAKELISKGLVSEIKSSKK